jgi:hypothetical protein
MRGVSDERADDGGKVRGLPHAHQLYGQAATMNARGGSTLSKGDPA